MTERLVAKTTEKIGQGRSFKRRKDVRIYDDGKLQRDEQIFN